MTTPHPLAALIKAWADGAIIQVRLRGDGGAVWKDLDGPGGDNPPGWFTEGCEYRIKPANVERFCPVFRTPEGGVVIGEANTEYRLSQYTLGGGYPRVGIIHLTITPDTLQLVSATMEKP
jgi:hypothetical protein